jgi:hypothetical protein
LTSVSTTIHHPTGITVEIVDIEASSNGRSCYQHDVCGTLLVEEDLRPLMSWRGHSMETCRFFHQQQLLYPHNSVTPLMQGWQIDLLQQKREVMEINDLTQCYSRKKKAATFDPTSSPAAAAITTTQQKAAKKEKRNLVHCPTRRRCHWRNKESNIQRLEAILPIAIDDIQT